MADIMLDLETLATSPDSVILTVGAIKFDPFSLTEPTDGFYMRLNVDEQLAINRAVDDNTVKFWMGQPEDIREEAMGDSDREPLQKFYQDFNKFLMGANNIWAQGVLFDIGILENLYHQMGWPKPWLFWKIRDSRTVFDMFGDRREKQRKTLHNAFSDAFEQAVALQRLYKDLGIRKNANNLG
jgi:hypothetical protein